MRPWHLTGWKPREGFEWVTVAPGDGAPPGLYLAPRSLALERVELRDPLLCRTFAELDSRDPGAVLAFADERGWLASELVPLPAELWPAGADSVPVGGFWRGAGEPIAAWQREAEAMRDALALLDAITGGARALRGLLDWSGERVAYFAGRRLVAYLGPHDPAWEKVSRRDPIGTARLLARELVNEGLTGPLADARLPGRSEPRVRAEVELASEALAPVAANLAGALWLQAAELLTGELAHRRCESCGRWFEVRRRHAVFCPERPSCRQAATEARRREARRLWSRGERSLAKIAERVGAKDARTVRGWVRGTRPAGRR